MKKLVAWLMLAVMVLSLAACGSSSEETTASETTAAQEETTAAKEDETTAAQETEAPADTTAAQEETETAPAEEGFVIDACIASEPETIDPSLISSVDGSTYVQHMFEGLMKYQMIDELANDGDTSMYNTEIVPGQAASYTVSDDQLVYTFTLRDDIFWSDGQPVTAADFEYSWKRITDPATASDYGYILEHIVLNAADIYENGADPDTLGIKALDEKTLEITLESPCAYFLELCAFASLMPERQDVVEGSDNWTDPANIVVNGPYKITEWTHDSYIRMEPNDQYYDAANLGPDAIVWWLSDSETAILSSYQDGTYDFIDTFPTDMIESMKASGDAFTNPYIGTYYLYLNCSKIEDWRVRAAMVLSIDRENIVENVTQGGQVPATGLVAQGITDSTGTDFSTGVSELGAMYNGLQEAYPDYDLSTYTGRCELAQDLYQAAVDEGKWDPETTIEYNFNTSDAHKAIAEACGQDWESVLGLKITLANQEWNTYTNGLAEHTFGVARLGWIADYNDPVTYLELVMTDNSYNYGLWSNADYDKLINDAKATDAGPERDAMLYQAEELMFTEGGFPLAPLYFYTQVYCMHEGIENVGFTPMGYYFFQYATQG